MCEKTGLEQQILQQLQAIALTDVTDVVQVSDGALLVTSTQQMTRQQRSAIASIERVSGSLKVKFYDKLKALELLGKYLGLFEKGPAATGGDSDLVRSILQSTQEVIPTHDLPEIQQTPATGAELVEQTGSEEV